MPSSISINYSGYSYILCEYTHGGHTFNVLTSTDALLIDRGGGYCSAFALTSLYYSAGWKTNYLIIEGTTSGTRINFAPVGSGYPIPKAFYGVNIEI